MASASKTQNNKAPTVENADIREISIPALDIRQVVLNVVGISSLIVHNWSAKSVRQLEGSQTGKAKEQKTARIPEEEWAAAAYIIPGKEELPDWKPGKYSFPASAFKHAFLYGVAQLDDQKKWPKTKATGWVYVDDDPVLQFESCTLRTDIVRNPTQMCYRPEFHDWSCDLVVGYDAHAITLEQVMALFDHGGFKGGIGEWRPSSPKNKSGSHGRFRISGASTT